MLHTSLYVEGNDMTTMPGERLGKGAWKLKEGEDRKRLGCTNDKDISWEKCNRDGQRYKKIEGFCQHSLNSTPNKMIMKNLF